MTLRPPFSAAIAVALLAGCGVTASPQPAPRGAGPMSLESRVSEEVLVGLAPGLSATAVATQAAALAQDLGLSTSRRLGPLNAFVMRAPGGSEAAVRLLRARPEVAWAGPNAIESLPPVSRGSRPTAAVSEADPGAQWHLRTINAAAAWNVTMGSPSTIVAVVDTGIDYKHPDLAGRVIKGRDFPNSDNDPMDGHSHGTHCAGIVGATANNGIGVAGVAPGVKLLAVKVMRDDGSGTTEWICNGITYAADNGARVISLSLGGGANPEAKQAAVDYARSKGAVVVVAMGNRNSDAPIYPAACQGVIAVGGTNADDTKAKFSNFGPWISVAAPAVDILSTIPGGRYVEQSGTSMATPQVAGLAALIRSADARLTVDEVIQRVQSSAVDLGEAGFDPIFGHGRIDALKAVRGTR